MMFKRNWMRKTATIVFTSLVIISCPTKASSLKINDQIWKSYWYIFKMDLQGRWSKLSGDDFNKIQHNQSNLLPCLRNRYGLSNLQLLREIYDYYQSIPDSVLDNIDAERLVLEVDSQEWAKNWAYIEDDLRNQWPELSNSDIQQVRMSPENLKKCIKKRNPELSMQEANAEARDFLRNLSQSLFYAAALKAQGHEG